MTQSHSTTKSFFAASAPLLLVIFIDSMGLSLVFPILNTLIFDPGSHFLAHLSYSHKNLLYGFTIGIYMFCWFFGAAFLGDLSDQVGRKKSLLICLLGAFLSYLLSAFAVVVSSYTLLLLGRIIAGATAGSEAIAQAAVVDLSEPAHKARNLGLIASCSSIGFVLGPLIGGLLSDNQLVSWFNYSLPFYFAALISLINAILLCFLFTETFTPPSKINYKLHHAIKIFVSAFQHEKIRGLSIVMLVMIFGWSGLYSFISMYLLKVYEFTPLRIGFYMAFMGIGFGIGTGFLIEPLTRILTLRQCVLWNCLVVALFTGLTLYAPAEIYIWFYVIIIGCSMAIAYSTLLTLFSNEVSDSEQGWVMGITGAIMAFAFGVNSFLIGLLANLKPDTPLVISILCLIATAILMQTIVEPGLEVQ